MRLVARIAGFYLFLGARNTFFVTRPTRLAHEFSSPTTWRELRSMLKGQIRKNRNFALVLMTIVRRSGSQITPVSPKSLRFPSNVGSKGPVTLRPAGRLTGKPTPARLARALFETRRIRHPGVVSAMMFNRPPFLFRRIGLRPLLFFPPLGLHAQQSASPTAQARRRSRNRTRSSASAPTRRSSRPRRLSGRS